MRKDCDGLMWQEQDYKTETKTELLANEGWTQVYPGFWAEARALKAGKKPRDICIPFEQAVTLAKGSRSGPKAEPPEPTWLLPSYLPGLQESRDYNFNLMSNDEIVYCGQQVLRTGKKHRLIFDIECYGNYFLIMFMSVETRKIIYEELSDANPVMNLEKLKWMFEHFTMIGFNSESYDMIIAALAVNGASTARMKSATSAIIEEGVRGYEILKVNKTKKLKCDHIDLIQVAPISGSLKIYGGRIHTKRMQDLPFAPSTVLSPDQITITRRYCINDLDNTFDIYMKLQKELSLREDMSAQYDIDLRSKGDAQIAEAVITSEVSKLNNKRCTRTTIEPGTTYRYNLPPFIKFESAHMKHVLGTVLDAGYVVGEKGSITLPKELTALPIQINNTQYKLGIGGLHSKDKAMSHFSDSKYLLVDKDVTSYYPRIIINQCLYPAHLGPNFLIAYERIVNTRLEAKRVGNKTIANSLKIVINGSFGKFGSRFSMLYSPQLLIQTTLTGQLALLMLIERLELAGIEVVSANTDGVVIKCERSREAEMEAIATQWQTDTEFNLENTYYKSLHARDVNNYIAVYRDEDRESEKPEDCAKLKGCFKDADLSKNPQNFISMKAVRDWLLFETPISKTIRESKDICEFVTVRGVKGGGVKIYEDETPNLYLGKAVRFYYSQDDVSPIVYAKSGNRVPASFGATPMMDLPDSFPSNVNYEMYEETAIKMIQNCGLDY